MNQVTGNPQEPHHDSVPSAWWKVWKWPRGVWVLVIGVIILSLPFGLRAVMLSIVPDIDEPFDVGEYVTWDVSPEDDAFADYRAAAILRKQAEANLDHSQEDWRAITRGWESVNTAIRQRLEADREALAVWRRGTEKPQGRPYANIETITLDDPGVGVEFNDHFMMVELARLEALHCEYDGRLDEAWRWIRAVMRCGGHVSHRGEMMNYLTGMAINSSAVGGMARWAEHSAVTSTQLKTALQDIRADESLYELQSNVRKSDYMWFRHWRTTGEWIFECDYAPYHHFDSPYVASVVRLGFWSVGEPELTMRIYRQALANQLPDVDKPLPARRTCFPSSELLFQTDPELPRMPGQVAPAEIDRGIRWSFLAHSVMKHSKRIDEVVRRNSASHQVLEALLAAQAYRRDHGELPENLVLLIPDYLDAVPVDPCDPKGGPVRYRRDERAKGVVWSVGIDGVDDGESVTQSGLWSDFELIIK